MPYVQHIHESGFSPLSESYQRHLTEDHDLDKAEVEMMTYQAMTQVHWFHHPSTPPAYLEEES